MSIETGYGRPRSVFDDISDQIFSLNERLTQLEKDNRDLAKKFVDMHSYARFLERKYNHNTND